MFLERSEYIIIAIIAVWKTGAAYVPIDINLPEKRIEYILNDTGTKILLTNDIFSKKKLNFKFKFSKILIKIVAFSLIIIWKYKKVIVLRIQYI